jgi:hypothetical protein
MTTNYRTTFGLFGSTPLPAVIAEFSPLQREDNSHVDPNIARPHHGVPGARATSTFPKTNTDALRQA